MFIIIIWNHDDQCIDTEWFWTLREAGQRALHANDYDYEWKVVTTDHEGMHDVDRADVYESTY